MSRRVIARARSATIGLAVSRDAVRAVAVRRERIQWAVAAERGHEPLETTIARVLADAPIARWPRARIIAAVGPSHAQTKRLARLPELPPGARMDDLVRESAPRFFLRNGIPLVTAIRRSANGEVWGVAVERPVVEAIERACQARHLRLVAVAPSVAILGRAVEGDRVTWIDGVTRADVEVRGTELLAVHQGASRDSCDTEDVESPTPTRLLASLGEDAWRFADALGAAVASPRDVLAWRPDGGSARALPRWRLIIASAAAVAAAIAWLVAPGVAATIAQRDAERRLAAVADVRRSVVMAERELARVTGALAEVAAFDSGSIAATMLLADLTRAMPEGAAVVALRVSGEGGTLVSLVPRAAAVMTALERLPGIEGVEIVGPVTREVVATRTVERLSLRFRFTAAARHAPGRRT